MRKQSKYLLVLRHTSKLEVGNLLELEFELPNERLQELTTKMKMKKIHFEQLNTFLVEKKLKENSNRSHRNKYLLLLVCWILKLLSLAAKEKYLSGKMNNDE